MVGSVTERLGPDVDFLKSNGTNVTGEVDTDSRDSYRVQVAAATTVLGGLIQVWQQNHTLTAVELSPRIKATLSDGLFRWCWVLFGLDSWARTCPSPW